MKYRKRSVFGVSWSLVLCTGVHYVFLFAEMDILHLEGQYILRSTTYHFDFRSFGRGLALIIGEFTCYSLLVFALSCLKYTRIYIL